MARRTSGRTLLAPLSRQALGRTQGRVGNMPRWLIQLEGDHIDLEQFPYWFPDGDVCGITEGEDVYLTGSVFEEISNPSIVYQRALEALDELSSIIAVLDPAFVRPCVSHVVLEDDAGERKRFVFGSVTFTARGKLAIRGHLVGDKSEEDQPTRAQVLMSGARASNQLHVAVSLFADRFRTWPRLYRILEEIERYLGQSVDRAGLCSTRRRRRFTGSANVAEISGRDARHASGMFRPPPNPMSLEEAIGFIAELLRKALEQAARES